MRIAAVRFLAGPNIHDDSSGVVIGTDILTLPAAGHPIVVSSDRSDRIFGALGIAGIADEWAATAAHGRAALAGFLLRLATALVTPASIFAAGGRIVASSEFRLVVFLRCEHERTGLMAWDCACKAVMGCLPGEDGFASFQAAHAAFRRTAKQFGADLMTAAFAREGRRRMVRSRQPPPCLNPQHSLRLARTPRGIAQPRAAECCHPATERHLSALEA